MQEQPWFDGLEPDAVLTAVHSRTGASRTLYAFVFSDETEIVLDCFNLRHAKLIDRFTGRRNRGMTVYKEEMEKAIANLHT